jgi:hypothetical protein
VSEFSKAKTQKIMASSSFYTTQKYLKESVALFQGLKAVSYKIEVRSGLLW